MTYGQSFKEQRVIARLKNDVQLSTVKSTNNVEIFQKLKSIQDTSTVVRRVRELLSELVVSRTL